MKLDAAECKLIADLGVDFLAAATRKYIEDGKDIEGKGYDPRKLLKPGCEAIVAKAKELAEGFEAAGKA